MIATALLLAQVTMNVTDKKSCFVERQIKGVPVMEYIGDRSCVALTPPRRMFGIWVDNFEGSAFFEGLTELGQLQGRKSKIWFSTDRDSVLPPNFKRSYPGNAYLVTFIGRTAQDMDRKPLEGYGHLGMSPGLVLVDRLIEWRDLGQDPRR